MALIRFKRFLLSVNRLTDFHSNNNSDMRSVSRLSSSSGTGRENRYVIDGGVELDLSG